MTKIYLDDSELTYIVVSKNNLIMQDSINLFVGAYIDPTSIKVGEMPKITLQVERNMPKKGAVWTNIAHKITKIEKL